MTGLVILNIVLLFANVMGLIFVPNILFFIGAIASGYGVYTGSKHLSRR